MVIENKTKMTQERIDGAMRASNFDNDRYKKFKLVYNLFGLLFGIMFVRSLVEHMLGSAHADTFMTVFFAAGAAIFLYIGMIGMDQSNKKRFHGIYGKMKGITFTYVIDSEEIKVIDEEEDEDVISWNDIIKWNQDQQNFYFFVNQENCLVMDKTGFAEGEEQDMKELARAVFAMREQKSVTENVDAVSDEVNGVEDDKDTSLEEK